MVLWYDIARQCCTNENMAKNPVLRDLSGNGHDATCYNFAWGGMSGIGGYAIDFNNWFSQSNTSWKITNKTYKTLIFKCISTLTKELTYINHYKFEKKNFSIQITSNNPELKFELISTFNNGTSFRIIQQNEDEVIKTDYTNEEFNTIDAVYPTLRITADTFSFLKKDDIITIEQLPLYPHALVSDGVDDYCLVEELPLLNKEDGYTVIAKRKWLDEDNEGNSSLITKTSSASGVDGAFMFECKHQNATQKITRSFGGELILDNFYTNDITYQISNSYNSISIQPQSYIDTNKMAMFRFATDANEYYGKFALYSLLLFNRDLTIEEIKWVKRNLM